jgi:hypothetical protein
MAREKATITLDREKAAAARELLGIDSTSEVIDVALGRLVRSERLRSDVAAYRRFPTTSDEVELGLLVASGDIDDDTDWDALYGDIEA